MSLLRVGIIGTVISALCCFTPMLVTLLGIVGLATWVGYLDYLLMPSLLFFLFLTVFALTKQQREKT
jgi:mercuric ion transport protein